MINATKDFQIYDSYPILYEYTNIQPHEIQVNSYEEIRIGNEKFFMKSINARDIYEKTHSISITFFGKLNVSPVFFKLLLFPEMNITNKTQLLERIGQSKEILTWTGEVFEE